MKPKYSVIVPCYNEEEVITETYKRLNTVMESLEETYEIIFINDGSKDNTAFIIAGFCETNKSVKLLNFSRNFGHMPALTAGLDYASGEAVFVIDADLQDPPEVFLEMITKWKEGYHVVYGKRNKRKGESVFKKLSAMAFYRFLQSMTNVDLPVDTGEFRLMDRKVVEVVKTLPEKNRYLRGLVSWVGFKQTAVMYDRSERFAGETKYPLRKMIKFAMDAITSFSYKPLKLATLIGFLMSIASFVYLIVIFIQHFFTDTHVAGWTSLIGVMLLTQGIVLIILGLMGEYVGRLYEEAKGRPLYIVQEVIGGEADN